MGKDNKSNENSNSFTLGTDVTGAMDMPSVTQLLNRKSLDLTPSSSVDLGDHPSISIMLSDSPPEPLELQGNNNDSSSSFSSQQVEIQMDTGNDSGLSLEIEHSGAPQPTEVPAELSTEVPAELSTEVPLDLSIEVPAPVPIKNTSPPKIQPSTRKAPKLAQQIVIWELDHLKSGADPLGQGIYKLFKKGAVSALFLSITAPPPGSPVPHFVAATAVLPQNKLAIWTGLKWDPTVVPKMWNYFIKTGHVELSPPGTVTQQQSNRNVVRAAFGIHKTEWLLLMRAGPAHACRGVVAFVATKSLALELIEPLQLISAPAPQSTK